MGYSLNGNIVEQGDYKLVDKLESHGYKWLDKEEKSNGDNKNSQQNTGKKTGEGCGE